MCYDVQALTKLKEIYAQKRAPKQGVLFEQVKSGLDELEGDLQPIYHVTGFQHPRLLVFTDKDPYQPQLFEWGLIPFWVKSQKQANQIRTKTLNARGETIFEKPAYKNSAKNKRCLIFIDAFYEHHHQDKQKIPFRIELKNELPMVLAGLWSDWKNEEGRKVSTCTIVTTVGNNLMAKIHNNPKLTGPRMPLILGEKEMDQWLMPFGEANDREAIQNLIQPMEAKFFNYSVVGQLRGKNAIGNKPEVLQSVTLSYSANLFDI